jgi:hypothetical protein
MSPPMAHWLTSCQFPAIGITGSAAVLEAFTLALPARRQRIRGQYHLYNCDNMQTTLQAQVKRGLSDCSALADYATAAGVGRTAKQLNQTFELFIKTDSKTSAAGIPSAAIPVAFSGMASGFLPQYQNTNGDQIDQTHHFAAFFEFGYQYGINASALLGQLYEAVEAGTDPHGYNQGDVNLAIAAASLGQQLAQGTILPDELGIVMQDTICKP